MKPGDLIVIRTSSTDVKPALIVELDLGSGYIWVLLDGQTMWIPVSYTGVFDEAR
jgi:hypothetical protein